jgi:hypothetical protein
MTSLSPEEAVRHNLRWNTIRFTTRPDLVVTTSTLEDDAGDARTEAGVTPRRNREWEAARRLGLPSAWAATTSSSESVSESITGSLVSVLSARSLYFRTVS